MAEVFARRAGAGADDEGGETEQLVIVIPNGADGELMVVVKLLPPEAYPVPTHEGRAHGALVQQLVPVWGQFLERLRALDEFKSYG